ncbi:MULTISPECIES: zinc ribbon domain-containing protein [unclassified Microcoleus]|uniref:zinc ribbon domain-containing protein n=1 Tax=unclassified Microcoleus TaxID=2642155 RepID=UPI00403F511B
MRGGESDFPIDSNSNCGHIQDMPLKERIYNCESCGHSMDRDLNAAINLSRLAKP